jgi:hypothetical protein
MTEQIGRRTGFVADAAGMPLPSHDRITEWVAGAEKVLADDLPAGHKLWKSWALDLADQVLALARQRDETAEAWQNFDQQALDALLLTGRDDDA